MIFIWLIIILTIVFYIKSINKDKEYFKYFYSAFFFKLFLSILFSIVYIFYYQGGDSIIFFDGSNRVSELLLQHPTKFFNELISTPGEKGYVYPYTKETGFPAYTMLLEKESYFLIKLNVIFSLITFKSYIAINIIYSFLAFHYSWKLFEFVRNLGLHSDKHAAIAILFIPSVSFWCSTISKDAMIFISIIILVRHIFLIISKKAKSNLLSFIIVLFQLFLIYNIRSIILAVIVLPFFVILGIKWSQRFKENRGIKIIIQLSLVLISLSAMYISLGLNNANNKLNEYMKDAQIIQQDFLQNSIYTGKKYTIDVQDYTPLGLLKAMPQSIAAGLYQPFPWEISATLILNNLESLLFMFLTWKFFRRRFWEKWKIIVNNEFLFFCVTLVLIYAFFTGFSSIIFGVLVRLRAPLLVFFALVLLFDPDVKKEKQELIS